MTRLAWNEIGDLEYEAGCDRGVFYPQTGPGVPWNGLISVDELVETDGMTTKYFDGQKYNVKSNSEGFAASLEAFTYPAAFSPYNGFSDGLTSGQNRQAFNLSYRVLAADDVQGLDAGYKIHLVYNAKVTPSDVPYEGSVATFNWDLTTTPEAISDFSASSHLIIDTRVAYAWAIETLEDILYGSEDSTPRFPTIQEVLDLFEDASIVKVTDHGDGSFTVEGPDEAVYMTDSTSFEVSWPSAVYVDAVSYTLSSL